MAKKQTEVNSLRAQVQALRDSARDQLRMVMIERRLQSLFYLNADMDGLKKRAEKNSHSMKVAKYNLKKADKEHPDFEVQKAMHEEAQAHLAKEAEELSKSAASLQAQIDEINQEIEKIEAGESKVSIEEVDQIVMAKIKA